MASSEATRPRAETAHRPETLPRRVPLPAVVQTLWSMLAMDSFVRHCLRRYPDDSMLTFRILGLGTVVSAYDPDLVRQIFTADSDTLRGGEINAQVLGILGPNSLLLLDGKRHLTTRRLLLPAFHGDAIEHHQQLIERITLKDIERWPLGKPFPLWPRMRAITMQVILQAVIGVRDPARSHALGDLLGAYTRGGPFTALAETRQPWLTRPPVARLRPRIRARERAEQLLRQEITEHRASPDGRQDILAMLIKAGDENGHALSDEELRDHILTLLGAGHDTTAATLAWAFELLVRNPQVLERLQGHADDDEYLTAVVNETLRARPVVDSAARKVNTTFDLGGHRLPGGTIVSASINALQHDPRVYPDPDRFYPERFLRRPAPYTLIPFGGGERRCIGASFAIMEIKTVLRTVLEQLELRSASRRAERATRRQSIAITPAKGTRVIAISRQEIPSNR